MCAISTDPLCKGEEGRGAEGDYLELHTFLVFTNVDPAPHSTLTA